MVWKSQAKEWLREENVLFLLEVKGQNNYNYLGHQKKNKLLFMKFVKKIEDCPSKEISDQIFYG